MKSSRIGEISKMRPLWKTSGLFVSHKRVEIDSWRYYQNISGADFKQTINDSIRAPGSRIIP